MGQRDIPTAILIALSKYYDFDFATNGNYLVLTFETNGYTPDAGFAFEVLDDVNWYAIKLTYDEFTYVKKTVLDNGRTLYECYIEIGMAKHTGSGKEDVSWANTKKDGLKVTIYIQYGAEKTVYLKSLNYVAELPKEGE